MQKQVKVGNGIIEYKLNVSPRAKRLRLSVYADGRVSVSRPRYVSNRLVERMIKEKSAWIIEKLDLLKDRKSMLSLGDYKADKEKARELVKARLEHFNNMYDFKYERISIRNQRTRWGSCSRQGNLNFNYRLIHLPQNLRDYIIVHELCHLKEFNHSKKFWELVSKAVPDYMSIRKELRGMGI